MVVGGCGRLLTALPTHGEASITSLEREIVHYATCISIRARQVKVSDHEGDTAFACADADDVMAPSDPWMLRFHDASTYNVVANILLDCAQSLYYTRVYAQ